MIYDKLVFIHIPKTGGSSFRNSLGQHNNLIYEGSQSDYKKIGFPTDKKLINRNILLKSFNKHMPFETIKLSKFSKDKPVITFVRNPFSRAVSMYFECIRDPQHFTIGITKQTTFSQFLDQILLKDHWFTIPMIEYIGEENLTLIDYIGKQEDMINSLNRIKKKFNIKVKNKLHNYNNSISKKYSPPDYTKFYCDDLNISKVYELYKRDFKIFDYNFDNFIDYEKKKINKMNLFLNHFRRKLFNFF